MGIKDYVVNKLVKHAQPIAKIIPFNQDKYWEERFDKYGFDVMYTGHKGYSREENIRMNKEKIKVFDTHIRSLNLRKDIKILDVGCGIGVYADYFKENGYSNYHGVDISPNLINNLHKGGYPEGFMFDILDITKQSLIGGYDLILLFSVTVHITSQDKCRFLLKWVQDSLMPSGYILLTESDREYKRKGLYNVQRPLSFYKKHLDDCTLKSRIKYQWYSYLFTFKKE